MITILQSRGIGGIGIQISHATGAPMYTITGHGETPFVCSPVVAWKRLLELRAAGATIPSKVMIDFASDIINNLAFAANVVEEEVVA